MNKNFRLGLLIFGATILPAFVFAYTSPGKPTGFVNDFAKVLATDVVQSLEGKLQSLEKSSGAQVSVVIISSLGDETIETYATRLFEDWGIGQKGKDNGLLILVSTGDREARIEVGYGLEGDVTDLQAGGIVRNIMIPAFKTGDYGAGISGAVDVVSGIIAGTIDGSQYAQGSSGSSKSSFNFDPFTFLFIFVLFVNILAAILGRTKSWWLGGVLGAIAGTIIGLFTGFIPVGIILIIILTVIGLVFDYIVSKRPPGSGPGSRSGGIGMWPIFLGGGHGGSGGFGGGGFGGFGGGRSGGGGASGSW